MNGPARTLRALGKSDNTEETRLRLERQDAEDHCSSVLSKKSQRRFSHRMAMPDLELHKELHVDFLLRYWRVMCGFSRGTWTQKGEMYGKSIDCVLVHDDNTEGNGKRRLASAAGLRRLWVFWDFLLMLRSVWCICFWLPTMGDENDPDFEALQWRAGKLGRSQPLSLVRMTGEPVTGWRLWKQNAEAKGVLLRLSSTTLKPDDDALEALLGLGFRKAHYDFAVAEKFVRKTSLQII